MTRGLARVALAAVLALSLVVVAGTGPAAAAEPTGCVENTALQTGNISATATEVDESTVRVQYDLGTAENLTVALHADASVMDYAGFEKTSDGDYRANGSTQTPWIEYASTGLSKHGYAQDTYRTPDHPVGEVNMTTSDGIVSRDLMYLGGHYHVHTVENGCETIRLIVPCDTRLRASPAAVVEQQLNASKSLDVGHRYDVMTMFAVENQPSNGVTGLAYQKGDTVVWAVRPVESARSTWLHEYIHSRQGFSTADDMDWFTEASATYYSSEIPRERDSISNRSYNSAFAFSTTSGVLTDPHAGSLTHYYKGTLVLHELDRRIRDVSGGENSLEDVFRRLNTEYADQDVTYSEFRALVAEEGDEATAQWLDEHAKTSANPEHHELPEQSFWERLTFPSVGDAITGFGDWVSNRVTGLVGLFSDDVTCSHGEEPANPDH